MASSLRWPSNEVEDLAAPLLREGRSERYAARDGNRGPRVQKLRILVEQESFGSQTIRLEHEVSIGADAQPEDFAEVEEYIRQRRGSGSSVIAAVFNTVNLFMGVALLSIVYAVAQGGFMSFVPLVLAGCLMCLSGSLLGSCMEEFPATSRPSYPDIATRAWGQGGRSAAVIFCFLELYGNSCMNLIVLWQECESLLSSKHGIFGLSPRDTAVLLGSLAILPFFLMGNLETLSYLSFVGIVCTVVVTVSVWSLVAVDPGRAIFPEGEAPGYQLCNPRILLSVGIFSIALSQHSALPSVRNSLADTSQFERVLFLSFGVLVFLFASVGAAGYYYFGDSAHEIVTRDLQISWIGDVYILPGFSMDSVLTVMVAVQGVSSIPVGIAVLQDMLLDIVSCDPKQLRVQGLWAAALRYMLFGILAAISYAGFDVLGAVEGLIGGMCSMTCSLLLPVLLYTTLKWPRLSTRARAALVALIGLSVVVLLLVIAVSVYSMVIPGSTGHNGAAETRATFTRLYRGFPW